MTRRRQLITRLITSDRPLLWAVVWTVLAVAFVSPFFRHLDSPSWIASIPLWIAAVLSWYRVLRAGKSSSPHRLP